MNAGDPRNWSTAMAAKDVRKGRGGVEVRVYGKAIRGVGAENS